MSHSHLQNPIEAFLRVHIHWGHESLALGHPVARVNVDVLTPQTLGTVVCKPSPLGEVAAIAAIEILNAALEGLLGKAVSNVSL